MKTYAYIDGGHLRECFTRRIQRLFEVRPQVDFGLLRGRMNADRVFYYDCLDEQNPEQENSIAVRQVIDRVKTANFYHLRYGTLYGVRGRKRSQKELDVLLATDMLTDGFYKNMENAVLLSGDLDFRPALDSLVRLGVKVTLLYDPDSTSEELLLAADVRLPLETWWIHGVMDAEFQRKYPMPERKGVSSPPDATFVRGGMLNGGGPVKQYEAGGKCIVTMERYDPPSLSQLRHSDEDFLLKRYIPQMEGEVRWD